PNPDQSLRLDAAGDSHLWLRGHVCPGVPRVYLAGGPACREGRHSQAGRPGPGRLAIARWHHRCTPDLRAVRVSRPAEPLAGAVACPDWLQVHYPLSGMPRFLLVEQGLQTPAGFTMMADPAKDDRTVGAVAAGSPADQSGLQSGDVIVKLRDFPSASEQRPVQ